MSDIHVTPADVQQHVNQAKPGDKFILAAGTYAARLQMKNLQGTQAKPITLMAGPGAVFDGGVSADAYRVKANQMADSVYQGKVPGYPKGTYPGLYPWMAEGQIVLQGCKHIRLVNLVMRRSWPTLIALIDSNQIQITGANLTDGTFAIGALGETTSDITIEKCKWVQDSVAQRMWQKIDWASIHGDPNEDGVVDIQNDWRLFDGDFFRAGTILGRVRIWDSEISAAFNAVHLFNDLPKKPLCRDVEVAHCTFREIRDNIFEAERVASNWWFHHNEIINCHKWISIEQKTSGYFYFFANRGWFDSIQGPLTDDHSGGGVFKTPKEFKSVTGPHYFFNNSFYLRGDYLRNRILSRFLHQNNALRFVAMDDPVITDPATRDKEEIFPATLFGNLGSPPADLANRFTTDWKTLDIKMQNDVVAHTSWPALVQANGYPVQPAAGVDPLFVNPFKGDFKLQNNSPCRGHAGALSIELVDGTVWKRPAGGDIGAWQGDELFDGPAFVATPANA
ncbi:hypothetical protein [Dongia rigui]|uniref:Pectate lyase n=1 Tax=Dongia rigui TaxID=940149 RepID=A0ABU5E3N7_9PROT|nr:hypothetical protein [Dongia rigui]MDY0874089.1 hypothetical protein [Dongia rigui]